jgi:type I restriction enzyme S subunit
MSELTLVEKLLDGVDVEWKTLEEIGEFQRGKRFVKDDMIEAGVPCIHYGEMYTHYGVWAEEARSHVSKELAKNLRVASHGDVIIVAAGEKVEDIGNGTAWLGDEDVVIHDACFSFRSKLDPKYVSYFLRSQLFKMQIKSSIYSGKISSINAKGLGKATIPIPCPNDPKRSLARQREIARILDSFTELTSELTAALTAELDVRKKQYSHYRDQNLTFEDGDVVWMALDEVCDFLNAKPHEKFVTPDGDVALMTSRFISTQGKSARYVRRRDVLTPAYAEDVALVMSDLPNGRALAKAFFVRKDGLYAANQRVCLLRVKDKARLSPRFLFYIVDRNPQLLKYDNGYDQTHLKKGWILGVTLPVPTLAEQERIVAILDKFDTLTTSLSEELPRELALRRKQYEHYCDLLLSFPKAAEPSQP